MTQYFPADSIERSRALTAIISATEHSLQHPKVAEHFLGSTAVDALTVIKQAVMPEVHAGRISVSQGAIGTDQALILPLLDDELIEGAELDARVFIPSAQVWTALRESLTAKYQQHPETTFSYTPEQIEAGSNQRVGSIVAQYITLVSSYYHNPAPFYDSAENTAITIMPAHKFETGLALKSRPIMLMPVRLTQHSEAYIGAQLAHAALYAADFQSGNLDLPIMPESLAQTALKAHHLSTTILSVLIDALQSEERIMMRNGLQIELFRKQHATQDDPFPINSEIIAQLQEWGVLNN